MKTKLLHAALFTPLADGYWGLPLLIEGKPGTAKTAIIAKIARACGWHCENLRPGARGEGAFGVTPMPDKLDDGTSILRYPAPEWVAKLRRKDGRLVGIVNVDELNTAPPGMQPALLSIPLDREVGGCSLGPWVRVLATMNPVEHAAGGYDLAAPVANRFGRIYWDTPEADDWTAWLVGGCNGMPPIDAEAEEARVMAVWPNEFAKACGVVAAFIRRRPELLHKMPPDGSPEQAKPWPSPRTWELATRALAGAEIHKLDATEREELVGAFIGTAAATEFFTWLDSQDLPDPESILDGKVPFKHDPERLDRSEAILSACTAFLVPKNAPKRAERAETLWKMYAEVSADAKDVVVPSVKAAVTAGLHGIVKSANPILAKLMIVVKPSK